MNGKRLKLSTRLSIVAYETVGLGAFIVLLAFLENNEGVENSTVTNFSWVFGFIGAVLILIGLELGALIRRIPGDSQLATRKP